VQLGMEAQSRLEDEPRDEAECQVAPGDGALDGSDFFFQVVIVTHREDGSEPGLKVLLRNVFKVVNLSLEFVELEDCPPEEVELDNLQSGQGSEHHRVAVLDELRFLLELLPDEWRGHVLYQLMNNDADCETYENDGQDSVVAREDLGRRVFYRRGSCAQVLGLRIVLHSSSPLA